MDSLLLRDRHGHKYSPSQIALARRKPSATISFPWQHENAAGFAASISRARKDARQREKHCEDKPIARTVPGISLCLENYGCEQEQDKRKRRPSACRLYAACSVELSLKDVRSVAPAKALWLPVCAFRNVGCDPFQNEFADQIRRCIPGNSRQAIEYNQRSAAIRRRVIEIRNGRR